MRNAPQQTFVDNGEMIIFTLAEEQLKVTD